jgi:hypothetical protein
MKPLSREHFNYTGAADYLGFAPSRFLALVRSGQIPARVPPGVRLPLRGRIPLTILFRKSDLDSFVAGLPLLKV